MSALTELELDKVREYMDHGWGNWRIAEALGHSRATIMRAMQRIRADQLPYNRKGELVQDLLNQGATQVEIGRAAHLGMPAASIWVDKIKGDHEPIDKQIRLELAKGTTLFKMMNRFGVSSIEEIRDLINDNFDSMLVVEKKLHDGDTSIVMVPDKSGQFDWLNQSRTEPKFKYHVNTANNYMYIKFDDDLPDEIKIYNFTDTHIGSKFCRTELLKQHIKMAAEDPAAFAFMGGDMFDFMHKLSVGQPWEQKLAPMEQVSCSARMFMPLAPKVLRYAGGNHDHGRGQAVGADLAEVLANLLKVSYGVMETVIDMEFKGNLFTAILHHGRGRGNTIQAILNEAETYRKSAAYFVNWHLSGHVHQSFILPRNALKKVEGKGLISQRYFTVIGGSYMGREGSYAEETKYAPSPQDLTYITMRADGSYGAGSVPIDSA